MLYWSETIRIQKLSPDRDQSAVNLKVPIDEIVNVKNPEFSITGQRLQFDDDFSFSSGKLETKSDIELSGMSPPDAVFHIYSHIEGKSTFHSNDFSSVRFCQPEVYLFRPRENPGGFSIIPKHQNLKCFELSFSIRNVIDWFDGAPPKSLRSILKDDIEAGIKIPMPMLWIYNQITQSINSNIFNQSLNRLVLEGMSIQMVAAYLSFLSDDKVSHWSGMEKREEHLAHEAKQLLLADLQSPPGLVELARMVGMSPRRLNAAFKEVFGQSVFQTLTHERLEYARIYLLNGNLSVKEIAYIAGYNHVSNFSAAFKCRYGITPKELIARETG